MSTVPPQSGAPRRPRKAMAIASLLLGILSLPTLGLLGIGALAGIGLGAWALVQARRAPQEFGGKGLAIGGIVTSAGSLLLVLLMPLLIHRVGMPRVEANEASTIADLRDLLAAEMAYRSANRGFYDTVECLSAPTSCIPNYHGPSFVDPAFASRNHGYVKTFYPGRAPGLPRAKSLSPSSLQSFAYVAVPTSGMTGTRAFCGDSNGRLCFTPSRLQPPVVVDGLCPTSWTPLP